MNNEQKKLIIEGAKDAYTRAQIDRFFCGEVPTLNDNILKGSCYWISSLIHHIAKNDYGVDDSNNKIFDCTIKYNGEEHGHCVNYINGSYIDASIEQFNDTPTAKRLNITFSPFDDNTKYYTEFDEIRPLSDNAIRADINYYRKLKSSKYSKEHEDITPSSEETIEQKNNANNMEDINQVKPKNKQKQKKSRIFKNIFKN